MDSNLLTISNILIQTSTSGPCASKVEVKDLKKENSKFSIDQDLESVNLMGTKSGTADNNCEIGSLENNNRFVVRNEKIVSSGNLDNLLKAQAGTKSEKKEFSKANNDEIVTNQESKITIGSLVREIARNNEPGGGRQLSELISSFKENRILPVTAKAAKSIENKQLLLTDNKQAGIKTVLPEESNGRVALKDDLPAGPVKESSNNSLEQVLNVSNTSSMDIKTVTSDNGDNTKLKPEVFLDKGLEKAVEIQPQSDKQQIDTLNIKKEISENGIGNVSKTTVTNVNLSLSQANSLQSIDKASEVRRKVTVLDAEKSASTEKQISYDEKKVEPQRAKDFSSLKEILQQVKDSKNKESDTEKLNILNAQITGRQTGIKSHSTSDDSINSKIAQMNSHSNTKAVTVDQPISTTENNVKISNFTNQGSSSETSINIGKQVLESIHNSLSQQGADKQISVRLNPPELGEVFIKFQEKDSQITGLLEVSKTQTRSEIEQILPQIIRDLSDSGVNIKRLEVVLTNGDQAGHETLKDASFFNNQQQQHNFSDSGLYDGDYDIAGIHEWLVNTVNIESNAGLQDALTMNDSINILI